jgi:hypothetical protein
MLDYSNSNAKFRVNAYGAGRWRAYAGDLAPLIAKLNREGARAGW